jgi:hypothetical protein
MNNSIYYDTRLIEGRYTHEKKISHSTRKSIVQSIRDMENSNDITNKSIKKRVEALLGHKLTVDDKTLMKTAIIDWMEEMTAQYQVTDDELMDFIKFKNEHCHDYDDDFDCEYPYQDFTRIYNCLRRDFRKSRL